MTLDQVIDSKQKRRLRAEEKQLLAHDRRSAAANRFIGQLTRLDPVHGSWKTVFYVWIGKTYREGTKPELISFLHNRKLI